MVLFRLMMPSERGLLLLRDEVISQFMNFSHLLLGETIILAKSLAFSSGKSIKTCKLDV